MSGAAREAARQKFASTPLSAFLKKSMGSISLDRASSLCVPHNTNPLSLCSQLRSYRFIRDLSTDGANTDYVARWRAAREYRRSMNQ